MTLRLSDRAYIKKTAGTVGPMGPAGPVSHVFNITTVPPAGMYPIVNIYWNPGINQFIGDYDTSGSAAAFIKSIPPEGMYAVTNLFFDPVSGRMTGHYEDDT